MLPSEARELKQLREENTKLTRLVADLSLDKVRLQDVVQGRPLDSRGLTLLVNRKREAPQPLEAAHTTPWTRRVCCPAELLAGVAFGVLAFTGFLSLSKWLLGELQDFWKWLKDWWGKF